MEATHGRWNQKDVIKCLREVKSREERGVWLSGSSFDSIEFSLALTTFQTSCGGASGTTEGLERV